MNWDEKVVRFQHERGINAMAIGASESIAANRQARIIARWQREQLRTDEAHHHAARAIARMEPDEEWPDKTEHDAEYRHQCYDEAWDIITAILGED